MTDTPPGTPGHGNGSTSARLQPTRIVDGYIKDGYTGLWEVICPACADSDRLDYSSVPPEIQAIRGPYATPDEAVAAVERHIGLRTEPTRQYGLG